MKRGEKGMTVIEVIVAVAISAIISAVAVMTVAQIVRSSESNNDCTTTVRQAQNLGHWISRDVLMAQTVTAGDDPETTTDVEFITSTWLDWETGDTHDIRYLWFDSADSLKILKRNQVTRDMDGVEVENRTTLVADNIYAADFSFQDGIWRLSVETRSGDKSVTREYEIGYRLAQ